MSRAESEEAFDNVPLLFLSEDETHSREEERFHAMGQTDRGSEVIYHIYIPREPDTRDFPRNVWIHTNDEIMSKQFKPIPKFASEDEEREFWATHSSSDYITDWSEG